MKFFSRSKIFLFAMVAFIVGIFLGNYFGGWIIALPITIILLACYLAILFLFLSIPKIAKVSIILIIAAILGIWRYNSFLPKIDLNHVGFYVDNKETYLVEGVVDTEPAGDGSSVKLQISNIEIPNPNDQITNKSQTQNPNKLEGKILVTVPSYYEINYGDEVRFSAKLAKPTTYETFDYQSYLARYGVYAIAKGIDDFSVIGHDKGSMIVSNLIKIKNYFSSVIKKIYPEPHGSFMLGILIGAKASLPDWLVNIFQVIGITHIIAISGYNITILAKVAEKTLGKIGRKFIFWGVLAMIFSFVIMTGAQASIVRAGIMGGLLVYAGFIGRRGSALNVLVLAGAVMIFINPLILRNDVGFQLSFLATLGLIFISPIFEKWFAKIPEFFRAMLSATLAAQVLTLPIIISSFGKLSLISPVANVIILGFIPASMFLGFASGLAGIIWLPLGKVIGFLGYIVLDIIIKISELLAKVPYASLEIKINNWWVWGGYYVVVGVLLYIFYKCRGVSHTPEKRANSSSPLRNVEL